MMEKCTQQVVRTVAALVGMVAMTGPTLADGKAEFLNSPEHEKRAAPYSQVVRAGGFLFLAGQLGDDPKSNQIVTGGIEAESRQALTNVKTLVERSGASMSDVVKCTVFLTDIAEWGQFNVIYKEYFKAPFPARSALGVSGLALGGRVEVECIVYQPK